MIPKIFDGREKKVAQDTHRITTKIVCEFQLNWSSLFTVGWNTKTLPVSLCVCACVCVCVCRF